MSANTINPFRPTRWEHHLDGRPLIWFTGEAEEIAADKSTYVYGTRGTGKTTLLKSICWEDLCFNESLKLQRHLADFRNIGLYIRFPDHIAASMSFVDWKSIFPNIVDPDREFYSFFSMAVEAICIERAAEACHRLRELNAFKVEASQELHLVTDFVDEYPAIRHFAPQSPTTFLSLARSLRLMTSAMNRACGRGSVDQLIGSLPHREPYQMLAYFTERAGSSLKMATSMGERSIGFKFCLDDCEVLNDLQRKTLNSIVRLSRAPCSWVVSSVGGGRDDSETFLQAQPLTDADRRVISLDGRESAGFRHLCQSVVSLRLLFALPTDSRPVLNQDGVRSFFDLEQRLGRRDVNDMMGLLVRRSGRPAAQILHAGAERLLGLLKKQRKRVSQRYHDEPDRLPFYEAYILMLWQGREDSFKTSLNIDDLSKLDSSIRSFGEAGFEAWLRRKQLGALMHFAASLGVRRLPLAGANVVVSLADGSMRDFLEIMGEIYEAFVADHRLDPNDPVNLARFATSRTPIAAAVQTSGIYQASEAYFEGVSRRSEIDTDVISRLIAGLGTYVSLLQSSPNDSKVLSTAERGVFFVNYDSSMTETGLSEPAKFINAALRQAELAGYLRPVEFRRFQTEHIDGRFLSVAFRLHRRFAPHFRFSYRGAYEGIALDPNELAALCMGDPTITPRDWAASLVGTAPRDYAQLQFPGIGTPINE